MRSNLQETLLNSLGSILTPLVSLLLKCGLGWSEFAVIARRVFVDVATEEYGIRGRPTNVSRVAAMTGLSRKEITKIRSQSVGLRWTPDMESTPANTVIHYWHYDPEFSESPGNPKPLVFDGVSSFSSLVRRYAGDIPPGALRTELKRAGTIMENSEGVLVASGRYFQPRSFHEDFIRNIAFSVQNLATTVAHNAEILIADRQELGRFERFAWTERLDPVALDELRLWVRREGAQFLERADDWIGQNELPREMWSAEQAHAVGVGVYYFEEDP